MKHTVLSSPTQNPKPAKTNMARVTTTRSIPPTPQDLQAPIAGATVDSIGDPVGGGAEPSSGVNATPGAASNGTLTASETPATKTGVQKDSKAEPVIFEDDNDADWVDEDGAAEGETDSSSSGSEDEEDLSKAQTKRAFKGEWSTVPNVKTTKTTAFELDAFKDMEALLDARLNEVAKKNKSSIIRHRAKTAACLAETRRIESQSQRLAEQMEFEAGLTPLELAIYQKTQLEDAMIRRIKTEYEGTRLKQETLKLRLKMLLLIKSSNNFSDESDQSLDSGRDSKLERILRDSARLLGDDFA